MQTINCKTCNKPIKIFPYQLRKSGKNNPKRFCCFECYLKWRNNFYKPSLECRNKISKSLIGNKRRVGHKPWITGKKNIWAFAEKNINWKGDNVSYSGLHKRMQRRKGIAQKCEQCGKRKYGKNSIHLANKSGKYLSDVSDWIYLCPKCHRRFDLANGGGIRGKRNPKVPNGHIKSRKQLSI